MSGVVVVGAGLAGVKEVASGCSGWPAVLGGPKNEGIGLLETPCPNRPKPSLFCPPSAGLLAPKAPNPPENRLGALLVSILLGADCGCPEVLPKSGVIGCCWPAGLKVVGAELGDGAPKSDPPKPGLAALPKNPVPGAGGFPKSPPPKSGGGFLFASCFSLGLVAIYEYEYSQLMIDNKRSRPVCPFIKQLDTIIGGVICWPADRGMRGTMIHMPR